MSSIPVTASMLYDLVWCPHRVTLDLFGDPSKKDPVSPFVQLLWERGNLFEKEVIHSLDIPFLDLSIFADEEKKKATLEAMKKGVPLIYSGRIEADDLLGRPDLLRKEKDGYTAGDIKSGAGKEGGDGEEDERKPKKHYAAQLALYTDILEKLGFSGKRAPFVWDVHGEEVVYELDLPMGKRKTDTLWNFYNDSLASARAIISRSIKTLPSYSSTCKLCVWYSNCRYEVKKSRDLTLIPELGRSKRDIMISQIPNIYKMANLDLNNYIKGNKTVFPGIGPGSLAKFQSRAKLLSDEHAKPYAKEQILLPMAETELYFDIETDPMRDLCYLHGFVERKGRQEKYVAFLAGKPDKEEEKEAFSQALNYIRNMRSSALYYYSAYEKSYYRKLQKLYPDIATEEEIEELFSSETTVDLYNDVVRSKTEWPLSDHSIKTIARYLGFKWRDPNPSGAASVEWYHRWVETEDPDIRMRILLYNEDDCTAMRVVVEGVSTLKLMER